MKKPGSVASRPRFIIVACIKRRRVERAAAKPASVVGSTQPVTAAQRDDQHRQQHKRHRPGHAAAPNQRPPVLSANSRKGLAMAPLISTPHASPTSRFAIGRMSADEGQQHRRILLKLSLVA
jgi:hypothetical protein